MFLRSAAAAAAISRLFICSANTANTGFTAASACLHVLVAGSRKANFEIGFIVHFLHVPAGPVADR